MSVTLTGFKEIDSVIKGMPLFFSHKVLQSAAASAAKPLVTKEQLLAPEGPTGNLIDSIGVVKESLAKTNELGSVIVGPRRRGKFRAFHAHLVEYGTRKRRTRRGANRGVMPAKPFVRPAFEATKANIISIYSTELGASLTRFMKRTLK